MDRNNDLQEHHMIPLSLRGVDDMANKMFLKGMIHRKLHDILDIKGE
jgi:hypothetical protein